MATCSQQIGYDMAVNQARREAGFFLIYVNILCLTAMPKDLSAVHLERIELMLRNALGRDLTSDERKYLGLSASAVPFDESEILITPSDERRGDPDSD
jgi:hypothetical protein